MAVANVVNIIGVHGFYAIAQPCLNHSKTRFLTKHVVFKIIHNIGMKPTSLRARKGTSTGRRFDTKLVKDMEATNV